MSSPAQESWRAALEHNRDVIMKVSGLDVLPSELEKELIGAHHWICEAGKNIARAPRDTAKQDKAKEQDEVVRTQATEIKRLNIKPERPRVIICSLTTIHRTRLLLYVAHSQSPSRHDITYIHHHQGVESRRICLSVSQSFHPQRYAALEQEEGRNLTLVLIEVSLARTLSNHPRPYKLRPIKRP
ncbi:hypothetical protein CBOM_05668 [Ceraceosorus bombacis]|uniref:Uncharacterized protein n=1 Tax=Ceraceosorus bombacis TaxID=401625 RepID=A0A0P1BR21_9BASI|nr:hypothetical protein CBOM_05668 [Ceraceosorus bombacis]